MSTNKWDSNNIPSQKSRLAIVTGSNSGIGFETARVLVSKEARVILAIRNPDKGNKALQKINEEFPNAEVETMELDLASLASVRQFAENFKSKFQKLDLLINNAGVMIPPYSKTAEGFELQFGTNHIGHFVLTGLLIDLLKKTTDSRVVNVSSMAHKYGKLDFTDLNWEKRKYVAWKAYGDSKIANLYFAYELQRSLGDHPVVAAAHPGWTITELQRHSGMVDYFNRFFAQRPPMGALPILYAAVGEDVKSGDYYGPSGFMEIKGYPKKVASNALSHNAEIGKKLWDVSEQLSGVKINL